jgi:hypothetical protein
MSDDQLSRHERTVLEILGLVLDDPAFVVRFTPAAQALEKGPVAG